MQKWVSRLLSLVLDDKMLVSFSRHVSISRTLLAERLIRSRSLKLTSVPSLPRPAGRCLPMMVELVMFLLREGPILTGTKVFQCLELLAINSSVFRRRCPPRRPLR